MAREFAEVFYRSKQWRRCRKSYIAYRISVDGGLCESCHERPGTIVHHKVWLTPSNITDPGITLSHDKLKLDCQVCHNRERQDERTDYCFDQHGQLQPSPPISTPQGGLA